MEMITMTLLGKIRRLRYRDGVSISEIARRLGLSRNTVKRWLNAEAGTEPRYRRKPRPTKLTPYEGQLVRWLEADLRRPKRERRTALALFGELKALGYPGSYTRVSEYIRRWRAEDGRSLKAAFVPLRFELGEAFQFDWSEEALVVGGVYRKLQVAHVKLCASRAFLIVAYPSQSHEMLFDAHTRAFRVFQGIPRRGIYDNMKTVVDKVGVGKRRIVNTRFAALTTHYLFDAEFCNVASGWEKGIVEKNVQDSRRSSGDKCIELTKTRRKFRGTVHGLYRHPAPQETGTEQQSAPTSRQPHLVHDSSQSDRSSAGSRRRNCPERSAYTRRH